MAVVLYATLHVASLSFVLTQRPLDSAWQRSFTRRCQVKLNDHVFNARKKSHATILEMDRLVREHPISECLRVVNVGELDPSVPLERNLQRTVIFVSTQRCTSVDLCH